MHPSVCIDERGINGSRKGHDDVAVDGAHNIFVDMLL